MKVAFTPSTDTMFSMFSTAFFVSIWTTRISSFAMSRYSLELIPQALAALPGAQPLRPSGAYLQ